MRAGRNYQPKLVLEMVCGDSLVPRDFIDESRATPLYREEEGGVRRHLATLRNTREGVELTPIDPLDGVFVRIDSPVRLGDGTRFRIGDYLIEPRRYDSGPPLDPGVERALRRFSKDLVTQGALVFLRPDGSDGTRFPILRKILIGRGGPGDKPVDIPLLDDNVSQRHASLTPTPHGLRLHDLNSTNGTFVQIRRTKLLHDGDWFRLGDMVLHLARYPRSG
jgi:pSer/pThr/pTyr-binding forkhead associated (FHA) protein